MNAIELANELAQPGAQDLLRSATLSRLAYTGLDSSPRVVPVGFLWTGEQLVVCTATTSPKVRALSSNGHVAFTIDTESAQQLLIRGIATLEVVDGVADEYLEASKKSFTGTQFEEFEAGVRAVYQQMVRISVRPQWARFFDFGAGRMPEFLTRLVENS